MGTEKKSQKSLHLQNNKGLSRTTEGAEQKLFNPPCWLCFYHESYAQAGAWFHQQEAWELKWLQIVSFFIWLSCGEKV